MEEFEVVRIDKDGNREVVKSAVAEEVPLTIEVNGVETATLLSSPLDLEELAVGFLYTSGVISKRSSILGMTVDRERWKVSVEITDEGLPEDIAFKRIYTSGCGKGVIFHSAIDLMQRTRLESDLCVRAEYIESLMLEFRRSSTEYKGTSGVHSVSLADSEKMLFLRDDIGRHNALDKVIGRALLDEIYLGDKIVLTSGRISSEIISKVVRCGVPVLATAKAPTSQAIKFARVTNLTVAAFVRGGRMSIYSAPERII